MLKIVLAMEELWPVGVAVTDSILDIVANIRMSVSMMMTAAGEEDALMLMQLQLQKNSVSANWDILALDALKVNLFLRFLKGMYFTGPYSLSCKQKISKTFGICPIIL